MKPFATNPDTGEPFVLASHVGISEHAAGVDDISSMTIDGCLYLSLTESVEWLEENLADREQILFFLRALVGIKRGDWHPED